MSAGKTATTVSVLAPDGTLGVGRTTSADTPLVGLDWVKAAQRAARKAVHGCQGITAPIPDGTRSYLWNARAVLRGGSRWVPVEIVVREGAER